MNKGGFSWKRLSGYSGAKSRLSRQIGVPLTKSGRQRKVGRMVTGGGCALPIAILSLIIVGLACGATGTITPTAKPSASPLATSAPGATLAPPKSQTIVTVAPAVPPSVAHANTGANLRAGPGTNYAKIGGATAGQALEIVGRNAAGDWLLLASGAWIAAQLVDGASPSLPVATAAPTAPIKAGVPTARGLPVASASNCDCDHGNTINCDDLQTWDAQACYLRCKELTGRDVHGLDRDSDGNACEWEY